MMADTLRAFVPVILIVSAVAMGYVSVLVAAHAWPTLEPEDRFSVEIGAAVIMVLALCAAFAGGKVW